VSREDSDCFKLQGDIVDLKPGGWFVIQFSDPTARARPSSAVLAGAGKQGNV
jgi:hypothetical protein